MKTGKHLKSQIKLKKLKSSYVILFMLFIHIILHHVLKNEIWNTCIQIGTNSPRSFNNETLPEFADLCAEFFHLFLR